MRRVGADGVLHTIAGTGGLDATDDGGPATAAQIGRPHGVAVGADGSLYIADSENHVIRRVGADGIIRTIAGVADVPGFDGDGGPATAAHLRAPVRVAVARDGTLFIGDLSNEAVRRVDPSGIITTVTGANVPGFAGDGGPAAAALLTRTNAAQLARGLFDEFQRRRECAAGGLSCASEQACGP